MASQPGRDQVPAMERLVRLLTVLTSSVHGAPLQTILDNVAPGPGTVEAKRRNVDRDIGHLNALGYDIRNVAPQGSDGIYRIFAHDNRLRVHLSAPQRAELLRAALLTGRGDLAVQLSDEPPPRVADGTGGGALPQLDLVLRAAARHCRARFTYKGKRRLVHPDRVHSGPSGWYLTGREDGAAKEFVVSRMSDVTIEAPGSAAPGTEVARPSLDPLNWQQDPATEVTLQCDAANLPLVEQVLGSPDSLGPSRDGVTRATYVVTNREVFRWRLYELGPRVTVVGPAEIRDEIVRELQAVVEA
jgi:predicted DNA-binding transcriptional regulator YafY